MSQGTSVQGSRTGSDSAAEYNRLSFIIRSLLAGVHTSMPVEVIGVSNSGGVSPVGTVAVKPLVNQVDGNGQVMPHGTVYGVPYLRIQGGANAVILDPQVGDIGIAVFCERDITAVKATEDAAPPSSRRRHDLSDAVYLHTILGAAPTQYVRFSDDGVEVVSPVNVKVQAPTIDLDASTQVTVTAPTIRHNGATVLNGPVSQVPGTQSGGASTFDGPLTVTNDVTAAGKSVSTHTHGNVQNGSGTTGTPN